jgi:Tn3 transposase DDE domain
VLLATLAEAAVEVLDELVLLFDQGLSSSDSRARHQLDERLAERAKDAQRREVLLDQLLEVLTDPGVPDEAVGGLLRGRVGMDALRQARLPAGRRPRRDAGHLELLGTRYAHLRAFTPGVLAALTFNGGPESASLLLSKLQSGSRHNTLARALLEYGRAVRTLFILRYLPDPELQRRVHRQLNKGESLHALRRRLFYANQGHVRRRHHEAQTEQALCLTVVTNAVVLFNTVYLQDALEALRKEGLAVTDEQVLHLSPALLDHINIYGSLTFDVEAELARTGHRALRPPPGTT